jgi:hypothetical protein
LLFAAHAPPAHADTVIVVGTPGVGGGPGGRATAEAGPNNDPINIANATGGAGSAGAPNGGAGGMAGTNAITSTADNAGNGVAIATSIGG